MGSAASVMLKFVVSKEISGLLGDLDSTMEQDFW